MKNKKITILCLMLLGLVLKLPAQTLSIQGTVTSILENDVPLPGVTIQIKGTSQGAFTDGSGSYRINANATDTLVFSFVGMVTEIIPIEGRSIINVGLAMDLASLGEIVVVGYGTQKKESLTASISNIKAEEIMTTTHSSLAQALQGKVAGLQIRQNTGEPGNFDSNINIRGFGNPLYVIDGVARDGSVDFQKLNPEDIESISVLKDASAAIYGLRAANGVIIVTTKKGREGETKFNYHGVTGFTSPTDVPEMLNAYQYVNLVNHARRNAGLGAAYDSATVERYRIGAPGYEGTNWYDETFKESAFQQQHNFSASGGTQRVSFYTSLGYTEDQGILKSNDLNYDRYSFRANITAQLTKNLKADVQTSGRYDFKEEPGGNFFGIFKTTRVGDPTARPYANNNTDYLGQVLPEDDNPIARSNRNVSGYSERENYKIQTSLGLTYDIPFIDGLSLKGLYSFDNNSYLAKNLNRSYKLYSYDEVAETYNGIIKYLPDRINNNWNNNRQVNLQTQVFYQKNFALTHDVSGLLVYEQNKTDYRYAFLERQYDFFTNDQIEQASPNDQKTDGYDLETGSRSVIGRFNYGYKSRYLLEYAFRYDGSYRYHPDQQWGFFPVISAAWRISEESFFANIKDIVSNLKLRGSYGIVGEDAGDPFQYIEGFTTDNAYGAEFEDGIYTTGVAAPGIVNRQLTWFTSRISNIGIDLELFNGSIFLETDVYQRYRTGLLARRNVSLPNTFGGELPQENLNSDLVKGIDALAGFKRNFGKFYVGMSGNINYYRTMNIHVERGPFTSSYDYWLNGRENRYNDVMWGYVIEGQFQNMEDVIFSPLQQGSNGNAKELPGDFKYKDINGDGIIDGNDRVPLFFNGTPKLHYGMTVSLAYSGFDFTALLQGSGRYTIRFEEVYAQMFAFRGNTPAYFDDAWKQDEDGNWTPGEWPTPRYITDMGMMYAESSKWRRDASYLRLKTVDIGYTLRNKSWLQGVGIDQLRVYVNGHNLITFADPFVKPFDPEKIEGAHSAGLTYPLSKSFNFGINVSF
jgi:TonB-linked SusC/RagA family outer membrane protein